MGVEWSRQKSNDIRYVAWKLKKSVYKSRRLKSQKISLARVYGKKIKR